MDANTEMILRKCGDLLRSHYGERLRGLLCYGSTARGQSSADSDIDLLVLLSGPVDVCQELETIIELLYPVQLESDRLISAKPADEKSYRHGTTQLYRNIRLEGVPV